MCSSVHKHNFYNNNNFIILLIECVLRKDDWESFFPSIVVVLNPLLIDGDH